jgi:tetratricopeptide (TPR) repeat protein
MEPKTNISQPHKNSLKEAGGFAKERRFKEALTLYESAVNEDPDNFEAWLGKAESEVMCLKYPDAIETCIKAIKLDQHNASIWFLKSFAHGVMGQYNEALDSCTRGLELDPGNNMVWCTRGQYLYALGRLEESLESFGKALEMSPNNPYFKEITRKVQRWLQRDNQNPEWISTVIAFLQKNGHQDALEEYKDSLNVDPRSVNKTFEKDYALAHLENPEKMMQEIEKSKIQSQPIFRLDISPKEFEFSRETWVEIVVSNNGKTQAREIVIEFPDTVLVKSLDISPDRVQEMKISNKPLDLDAIPVISPDSSVKKLVSLIPKILGQYSLDIKLSYIDSWDVKQVKNYIAWISVFKPNEKLPSIPGYKTLWRLNSSDHSSIYIAQQSGNNSRMVLKMLQFESDQKLSANEYINEIKQCSRLSHPNIIRYIDFGESPYPWVIMEYMPNGTLTRKIGKLSIKESLDIFKNLLDALAYAKSVRMTHRGINPDNIIFDERDNPKFTNFRTSFITQRLLNKSIENIVTPYFPPEQISPKLGSLDWTSDLYQLSAVLFTMIAGYPPFRGSGKELISQIETENPPLLHNINSNITPELSSFILKCMSKKKKERYPGISSAQKDFINIYKQFQK